MPTYLTFYAVKGLEGVNAFPVRPGDKALLIDSEEAVIYVKSTSALGQPLPLEIYDLVARKQPEPVSNGSSVSMDEVGAEIDKRIKAVLSTYFPSINFDN